MTLSGRLEARELTNEMKAIGEFQKDMIAASEAMGPAAQQLQQMKWKDAIPNEQKALQALLRAEATFRQIQVAFGGRGGGGGGGGGGGAARDLAALFDLELDTEKNQYETRQTASASTEEQKAKEVDDALKKLDELAKRQEDLAQQQRNNPVQTAEQKMAAGNAAAGCGAVAAADGAAAGAKRSAGATRTTRTTRAAIGAARPTGAAG